MTEPGAEEITDVGEEKALYSEYQMPYEVFLASAEPIFALASSEDYKLCMDAATLLHGISGYAESYFVEEAFRQKVVTALMQLIQQTEYELVRQLAIIAVSKFARIAVFSQVCIPNDSIAPPNDERANKFDVVCVSLQGLLGCSQVISIIFSYIGACPEEDQPLSHESAQVRRESAATLEALTTTDSALSRWVGVVGKELFALRLGRADTISDSKVREPAQRVWAKYIRWSSFPQRPNYLEFTHFIVPKDAFVDAAGLVERVEWVLTYLQPKGFDFTAVVRYGTRTAMIAMIYVYMMAMIMHGDDRCALLESMELGLRYSCSNHPANLT